MTTPTTPDVALPEAMVEAAARALAARTPLTLDYCRKILPDALTAALAMCEVHEQWRATDFDGWSLWLDSREHLTSWVERFGKKNGFACQRRLKITTPAEPDPTVGQP